MASNSFESKERKNDLKKMGVWLAAIFGAVIFYSVVQNEYNEKNSKWFVRKDRNGNTYFTESLTVLGPYFKPNKIYLNENSVKIIESGFVDKTEKEIPYSELKRCNIVSGVLSKTVTFKSGGILFPEKIKFTFVNSEFEDFIGAFCREKGLITEIKQRRIY